MNRFAVIQKHELADFYCEILDQVHLAHLLVAAVANLSLEDCLLRDPTPPPCSSLKATLFSVPGREEEPEPAATAEDEELAAAEEVDGGGWCAEEEEEPP